MTVNCEARKFEDEHQAAPLAEWCSGSVANVMGQPCITVLRLVSGSRTFARFGDWIIRFSDGTVRIDRAGNQDGYCTDCGEPVWWRDSRLVTRSGLRWCQGKDNQHPGMTRWHALPGMAQYVVRSPDGQVCRCLDRPEPHIHQTIPVTE